MLRLDYDVRPPGKKNALDGANDLVHNSSAPHSQHNITCSVSLAPTLWWDVKARRLRRLDLRLQVV